MCLEGGNTCDLVPKKPMGGKAATEAGPGDADHLTPPIIRFVPGALAGGLGTLLGRIRAGQARGLKLLHFPAVAVQSGLWPALLTRMKIDLEAFITRHLDQIIPRITTQSPLNQVTGM